MNLGLSYLGIVLQILLLSESCMSIPNNTKWYPTYHMAPDSNWMNDPNGLIYWNDYYHLFYQHYPDAPHWGLMHWGHARSKNLVQWEHLPIALTPSIPEDINGCYSGSAIDDNGTLTLMYTGVSSDANGNVVQVQCLATSQDGVNFTKVGKVIDTPGQSDFRDPKVWKESDGNYYVVIGSHDANASKQHGEVLLYKSANLRQWESMGTLLKAEDWLGYMWECPDLFKLGEKYVFAVSPQGIEAEGNKYQNVYQSGYFLGNWTPGSEFNVDTNFTEFDNGQDFYAPQSFLDGKGRRIQIGWLDMWNSPYPEQEDGWAGMMALPREVKLGDNGKLKILPIEEVAELRQTSNEATVKTLVSESATFESSYNASELLISWDLNSSTATKYGFRFGNSSDQDSSEGIFLYVNNTNKQLVLERQYSNYNLIDNRSIDLPEGDDLSLHIFFDMSSVEVFINDGEAVMSSRMYPMDNQRHLTFFAEDGSASMTFQWWSLSGKSDFFYEIRKRFNSKDAIDGV